MICKINRRIYHDKSPGAVFLAENDHVFMNNIAHERYGERERKYIRINYRY